MRQAGWLDDRRRRVRDRAKSCESERDAASRGPQSAARIECRGRNWYPTGKAPRAPVTSIRGEHVVGVLAAHAPLTEVGVHAAIERLAPGVASKAAVAAEVKRMRAERLRAQSR